MNKQKWYECPHCGKRLLKYDEVKARSNDVFIKCRNCKEEIEIRLINNMK